MKHYTTIEQSKKLLELGLNPKSADMTWQIDSDNIWYPIVGLDVSIEYKLFSFRYEYSVPCWSVGALENLIWKSSDGCVDLVCNEFGYFIRYGSSKCHNATGFNNTIIDACFEMVCWLLENDYIKKGE